VKLTQASGTFLLRFRWPVYRNVGNWAIRSWRLVAWESRWVGRRPGRRALGSTLEQNRLKAMGHSGQYLIT